MAAVSSLPWPWGLGAQRVTFPGNRVSVCRSLRWASVTSEQHRGDPGYRHTPPAPLLVPVTAGHLGGRHGQDSILIFHR